MYLIFALFDHQKSSVESMAAAFSLRFLTGGAASGTAWSSITVDEVEVEDDEVDVEVDEDEPEAEAEFEPDDEEGRFW